MRVDKMRRMKWCEFCTPIFRRNLRFKPTFGIQWKFAFAKFDGMQQWNIFPWKILNNDRMLPLFHPQTRPFWLISHWLKQQAFFGAKFFLAWRADLMVYSSQGWCMTTNQCYQRFAPENTDVWLRRYFTPRLYLCFCPTTVMWLWGTMAVLPYNVLVINVIAKRRKIGTNNFPEYQCMFRRVLYHMNIDIITCLFKRLP